MSKGIPCGCVFGIPPPLVWPRISFLLTHYGAITKRGLWVHSPTFHTQFPPAGSLQGCPDEHPARNSIPVNSTVLLAIPKMLTSSIIIPLPNACVVVGHKNAYADLKTRASGKKCAAIRIAVDYTINKINADPVKKQGKYQGKRN